MSDIEAAGAELAERGVDLAEVRDEPWGARHAWFKDRDGNGWSLQQPGRQAR